MTETPITLTDAAAALRDGTATSVELVSRASALADAHDDVLGVYLARFDEAALAAAEQADAELAAGTDRGPLHGIPIGMKDILAVSEGPTTGNSQVLDRAWGEGKDAPVVQRLKAAGAIITGKVTTMEFAIGIPNGEEPFPLPRNPWDTDTWPGGSSSGTGAGVAGGFFYAGIGTDTAGSIRIPAAYCGVSGLMPTYGRVPKSGCVPLGYSLDHIGPLARSARDCGVFLQAIAGPDPTDLYAEPVAVPDFTAGLTGSLEGVRIGVERANHFGDLDDPAAAPAFEAALAALQARGATLVDLVIPHYGEVVAAQWVTMVCEAFAYHRQDMREQWTQYFAATREMVGLGATFTASDFVAAQRVRRVAQRDLATLFAGVDVIATPTTTAGAPTYAALAERGVSRLLSTIRTPYWDATGNPVLVVPMGMTEAGLPLSLQLAAAPFAEDLLIRAGDAYQQETDWHLRVPPLLTETIINA